MTRLLRIAAIDFLNPAPLMWNFEHPPEAERLRERYLVRRTTPAACAAALAAGEADLGLIPIGAYPESEDLLVLPGCAIASLGAIRSLLLVVRTDTEPAHGEEPDLEPPLPSELDGIRTVALDSASRTSALYLRVLFGRFWNRAPTYKTVPPDLENMLETADAALLIGDPALQALRDRDARRERTGERLRYFDLGHLWREATGTAWVSAFWAVRAEAFHALPASERAILADDLVRSRDTGLAHLPELVRLWAPRLGLRPETVHTYLSRNIHYALDAPAVAGVERFFEEAHTLELFPSLPRLTWAA